MRRAAKCTLVATAALAALAATGAAAGESKSSSWIRVQQLPTGGSMAGTGEQIEIYSFHWGPRQSTSVDGARRGGGNHMTMDDTAGREKMQPGGGGAAVGANETITVGGGRTESGQATGKRQHKPFVVSGYYDAPLPRGSVRVKVKMPWPTCRVGAAYPRLELAGGGRRYVLEGVTVASCGHSSADDRPTEEVAFYYNKIG